MKIPLSIIATFYLYSLTEISVAQIDTIRNSLYINPSQLIFREIMLTYKKRINHKLTIGISLGYRPEKKSQPEIKGICHGICGDYKLQNMGNPHYNAITFSLTPELFFWGLTELSFSCDIFNRYWWFDSKYVEYNNVEGYRFKATRTEKVNVLGIKILVNKRHTLFNLSKKVEVLINGYGGIGYRVKFFSFESWNGTINDQEIEYDKTTGIIHLPSVHVGAKIGIGLK